MSAMTDAVTSAPDPAATSATPRPRRTWDLILTIVLLIAYLLGTLVASFSAFFLAFAGDSCGASSVCDENQMANGMMIALYAVWIPALFVVIGAIVLLVLRRLAFWVPLVGGALTIIISIIGWAVTISAVRTG